MSFDAFLLSNDPVIRLAFFLGMFGLMAAWELFAPRRVLEVSKPARWTHNISIAIINVLLVRVFFPSAAVGVAVFAEERGTGLLNMFAIPYPLAFLRSLLALDLTMYLVHLMFHAVPTLWRVHRVHHADVDFDVTTGARFHPIQIILAVPIKFAVLRVGPAGPRCAGVRSRIQRVVLVQPRERSDSADPGARAALVSCHPRHAPGAPLRRCQRNQQQLQLRAALVGPPVRHLPRPTRGRARADDDRRRPVPCAARLPARSHAAPTVPRRPRSLCDQPKMENRLMLDT